MNPGRFVQKVWHNMYPSVCQQAYQFPILVHVLHTNLKIHSFIHRVVIL